MHPATSIILFTTLSGLGFGFLAFLNLGLPMVSGWNVVFGFGGGLALASAGLVASAFHLGHPERALKAFTQWRSSWLSREGWLACATLAVTGANAALTVFTDIHVPSLGWIGAALCIATVIATSMIYAQLRAIPRWNHWSTNVLFLLIALCGGALLSGLIWPAFILLATTGMFQIYAWKVGDTRLRASGTTLTSATSLGASGTVRSFESPHTGDSYLTREMIHVIARRHSRKLRRASFLLGFVLPVILLPFTLIYQHIAVVTVCTHVAGVFILRWLFFAEAEHVVGFYYGKR